MKTPICDFVSEYSKSGTLRMHMPGHKGKNLLGIEHLDITEIKGADSLYEADGIIAESEKNASALFGCKTFYSAEGSSLGIRAMLYLTSLYSKEANRDKIIWAGRNAHKTFINTVALLDLDIEWLSSENGSYLSYTVCADKLEEKLKMAERLPTAIYLTSPDYLGNTADIKALSAICKKYGVLLLVDNAHGAYLHFLKEPKHPIELGADMCCDSAHKTLPVLTGGAYLHISNALPHFFENNAKMALALFGSTSPSYLILQSLDKANQYLSDSYKTRLCSTAKEIESLKIELIKKGYNLVGNEELKITFETKKYGYTGIEFAEILRLNGIECEFCDPDYTVLMLTPENGKEEITRIKEVLLSIEKKTVISSLPPKIHLPKKAMSIREATLSPNETIDAKNSLGRVLAFSNAACPPAVPIVVSGEIIDENAIKCCEYYGIEKCCVVKS